jgi:hypothetical protein
MQAIELETEIDENHEMRLKLPEAIRAREARVVVRYEETESVPAEIGITRCLSAWFHCGRSISSISSAARYQGTLATAAGAALTPVGPSDPPEPFPDHKTAGGDAGAERDAPERIDDDDLQRPVRKGRHVGELVGDVGEAAEECPVEQGAAE